MLLPRRIQRANARNLETLRVSPLAEISGALGDLGTLLPLMIALAAQGSVQLGSTLVFSGLFNVLTGVTFGVPLPVQPMKAIASAALSHRANPHPASVSAAGMLVGLSVLLMSATGLLRKATALVPVPVIKGIQLGAGLSLIIASGSRLLSDLSWATPLLDSRLWAAGAFLGLLCTQTLSRFPYALCLFTLGLAVSIGAAIGGGGGLPNFSGWMPELVPATGLWRYRDSAISMAVAQLPLTTLNSIIAVSALSTDLIPDVPAPSVTALGFSIAAMNLSGPWLGCMPVCHGSGGLAAQYRFGARSGASVVLLGLFKLALGLIFGNSLVGLLDRFPRSILGVMVLAAGLELAKIGAEVNHGASDLLREGEQHDEIRGSRAPGPLSEKERDERRTVMLMTAAGILAFRNDAVGFVAGMLCYWAYKVSDRISTWDRPRWHRSERVPLLS